MSWNATTDALAAVLRDEDEAWPILFREPAHSLSAASAHGVTHLLSRRLPTALPGSECAAEWRATLLGERRSALAVELAVGADLANVITALDHAGVTPVLFKGAALAYSVYASPELRPRNDCDVLIREGDYDVTRRTLEENGFVAALSCERLFGQIRFDKSTPLGLDYAIDVHWRISTQTLFANLLTYDELAADSVAVPGLGAHARAAGLVHGLLLACVHPVMHHRNEELLIWVYDVHLLAARLSAEQWRQFVDLARARGVSAICFRQLQAARQRFHSGVPDSVLSALSAASEDEAAATYLAPGRRWRHELRDNVRHAGTWAARVRVLLDVMIPDREYLRRRYGISESSWGTLLLPFCYVHRLARGGGNVLSGRK
jgi:hypothetical protein